MRKRPNDSDVKYVMDIDNDYGHNLTVKQAKKAYKEIGDNCYWVEEEFYYAAKEYFR